MSQFVKCVRKAEKKNSIFWVLIFYSQFFFMCFLASVPGGEVHKVCLMKCAPPSVGVKGGGYVPLCPPPSYGPEGEIFQELKKD